MRQRALMLAWLALPLLAAGCKTIEPANTALTQQAAPVSSKSSEPVKMAVIWTDANYTHPGKPITRGFGGRIYFYDQQNKAVDVDGEFVVYAYDDSKKESAKKMPERKYVFPAEYFAKHRSESKMGPSYSVWIPWDPVGGDEKHITLVPAFRPTNGRPVFGDQTVNILPGVKRQPSSDELDRGQPHVQLTSATEPVSFHERVDLLRSQPPRGARQRYDELQSRSGIPTFTVDVPHATRLHLQMNGQAALPAPATNYGADGFKGTAPMSGASATSIPRYGASQIRGGQRTMPAGVIVQPGSISADAGITGAEEAERNPSFVRIHDWRTQEQPQRSTRFALPRFPVQGAPGALPGRGPTLSPQRPAGSPFAPTSAPQRATSTGAAGYSPNSWTPQY